MSYFSRKPVLVLLATVLVWSSASLPARAQCQHHGGRGPGPMSSPQLQGRQPPSLPPLMQPQSGQQQLQLQQIQQQQQQLQVLQQQLQLRVLQQQTLQAQMVQDRVRELAEQELSAVRAALRDRQAETRWAAAWLVGQQKRPLQNELTDVLTDSNGNVRQAARESLVQLAEAAPALPGDRRLVGMTAVDFGPEPEANKARQMVAARKWRAWWQQHELNRTDSDRGLATVKAPAPRKTVNASRSEDEDVDNLASELIHATGSRQERLLVQLRDGKGGGYTQSLADAIPQLSGEARKKAREVFAERLARMTAGTLRTYLKDENPEVRRAAALACAMKEGKVHIPDLLPLLGDSSSTVRPAAEAALRSLTGQNFGSLAAADPARQATVAAAWKTWWQASVR